MAAGVSSDLVSLKAMVWQGVQQLTMGREVYETTLRALKTKKNEPAPQCKNPAFQEELNKTHNVYRQCIENSISNIEAQYALGQELKTLFERDFDLLALPSSLTAIESRLTLLLHEHKANEAQIKRLEDRIVVLIS